MLRALKLAGLLLITTLPAIAAERSFEYCTVCHGANGNGNVAIHAPRIAGMEPWYIRDQLTAFRSGWRGSHGDDGPGNEMRPVAQMLTPAEEDRAIAYVGTFSAKPTAITVSGDVEHGRSLYATCAACHGAGGRGNESLHAPALAQRSDWYLLTQLHNYRAGLRGGSTEDAAGQQMRTMATSLADDAAMNDVVAYIDTLR